MVKWQIDEMTNTQNDLASLLSTFGAKGVETNAVR
jgi:hypothetical protein